MTKQRLVPLVLLCGSLALFGFGCKKMPAPKPFVNFENALASLPRVTAPQLAATSTHAKPADPNIIYLRSVMKNFDKASSFRADVTIPSPQGNVTGNIEVVRATGLHGTLRFPQNRTTEIYLLGSDVFFRANTSTWSNLGATDEGKQVSSLVRAAFSLSDNESAAVLPDSARVVGTANDPSGCRLFLIASDQPGTTQICVKNELPIRLISPSPQGDVTANYRDFGKTITLTAPKIK